MKDVQKLIDEKQDLNKKLAYGRTILHQKALEGNINAVRSLVENGAHVTVYDEDDLSPLHMACRSGSLETVKFLLAKQAHHVIVPSWGNQADATTFSHDTCVGLASARGALDVVQFLVEKGFRFDMANDDGDTPLFLAMRGKYKNVATYLMEKGADIHRQNGRGETLISMAIWSGDMGEVSALLQKGVDINQPIFNVDGMQYHTPLSFAIYAEKFDVADFLMAKGADVNKADLKGNTPLSVALERFISPCYYKRGEYGRMVNRLMQKGADVTPIRQHYEAIVEVRKLFELVENPPRLVLKSTLSGPVNVQGLARDARG